MSASLVQATVHALTEHGRLPIGRLAALLGHPVAEVRAQLTAFNDVDTTDLVLDPMFAITPAGGWPEDDTVPDPAPADTDIVAFSPAVAGTDLEALPSRAGDSGLNPFELLGSALDALQAAGALAPEHRPGAEYLAWSTVHGMALLSIDSPLRQLAEHEAEALGQRILDMVERGLG